MRFLASDSLVVDAIKQVDWSSHSLGWPDQWSPALRSHLYTMLNSASAKMLLWGAELFTFYNDSCAKLIQRDEVGGLGMPYPQFRPALWPRVRTSIERALAGDRNVVDEFRTEVGVDGVNRAGVYELYFSPLMDENRDTHGVLIDVFDVTDREDAKQNLIREVTFLNSLFANTPALIAYATVPDLELRYVNSAFSDLLGNPPLVGLSIIEALPPELGENFEEQLRRMLKTGRSWAGRELPVSVRSPGGQASTRFLDIVFQPVPGAGDLTTGILFSGYEVTDRKEALEESDRLRHRLLHSTRASAMSTMAGTIAHELNQPLTAASNYLMALEISLEGREDEVDDIDCVIAVRDQLIRAGMIVRRMRALVESGTARAEVFELTTSVDQALELARASGSLDDFDVTVDIRSGAEAAFGDNIQIEQVLVNLLRNAAQASAECPQRSAHLKARRLGSRIEICLRDRGRGIPPDRLSSLFGTMQEPISSTGGLGVGLSLCRTIVEAHGGQISGSNCPDGGALFCFTLPSAEPNLGH